jgi:hypothetical protein
MIKISVKGLAKFITSPPAAQRKVLRDYKYPDDDEPAAMRLYYKDATDRIQAFHRSGHGRAWLRDKVNDLMDLAQLTPGRAGTRLRHNARALAQYERHFADRRLEPQGQIRLSLDIGNVRVTVTPDLYVVERGKLKVVKLEFSKDAPTDDTIKVVSQTMFEAAKGSVPAITSSGVLYLDVPRGLEYRGARAGAKTLREIEAACKSIESLWPGI